MHNGRVDGAELTDRILLAADLVPAGRVVSYGDIAELVGTTARLVGRVMAVHGHDVCWWRVVSSTGGLPAGLRDVARPHWLQEGTALRRGGQGCAMAAARADLGELAAQYQSELDAAG